MSETISPPIEVTQPKDAEDIKLEKINQQLKAKQDQENAGGEVDAEGADDGLTPEEKEKRRQKMIAEARKKQPFYGVSGLIKKYFDATSGNKQS